MNDYLFTYNYEGSKWSFVISAKDPEDARKRLAKVSYATYDGELMGKIPMQLGWFADIACLIKNMVRK